ncbi:hypothetical protein [Streptomyces pulveraceus]|uniref:Uncharacterized protein n=1 Tax=Streptomyces pulveraceus TaxID=68258 RepID=A0ABW1GFL6_9ACTN
MRVGTWSAAELDVLIEAATVGTRDVVEAVDGFLAVMEEHLAIPFSTTVLGVEVNVVEIGLTNDSRVVAGCVRGGFRQDIGRLDLPLPVPPPDGAQWVEPYRCWSGRGAGAPR